MWGLQKWPNNNFIINILYIAPCILRAIYWNTQLYTVIDYINFELKHFSTQCLWNYECQMLTYASKLCSNGFNRDRRHSLSSTAPSSSSWGTYTGWSKGFVARRGRQGFGGRPHHPWLVGGLRDPPPFLQRPPCNCACVPRETEDKYT